MNEEAVALLPDDIRDAGVLEIASPFDYPPFTAMDEAGVYSGSDYELANEIAVRLGLEPKWERLGSFSAVIPAMQSARFDMAVDGVASLPERLAIVSFVEYFVATYAIQVHDGNPKNLDPDDLCGTNFGATTGSNEAHLTELLSEKCVADGEEPLNITFFGDAATADAALRGKQVDAVINDAIRAEQRMVDSPNTYSLLYPKNPIWDEQPSAIVIRKNAPGLGRAVEMVLNDMQDDGTYQEIMSSYNIPEAAFVIPARFVEE